MQRLNKPMRAVIIMLAAMAYILFVIYDIVNNTKRYDVTFIGKLAQAGGLSRQAADAASLLDKDLKVNGIGIIYKSKRGFSSETTNIFNRGDQFGRVVVFEDVLSGTLDESINSFAEAERSQTFKQFAREEQIYIAYTMFEATAIPRIWVDRINSQFDMVVVPDQFLIDVYKNSGVTKPIFVVPLGINLQQQLDTPLKTKPHKKFTYANLGAGANNKNQLKLVQAFVKVQKQRPDTYLIINSRHAYPEVRDDILKFVQRNLVKNFEYTVISFNQDSYLKLFQEVDCLVYPSKGEGFSIQPREAMALGIPTIVTNNTAQKTICKSGLVECVDSNIERSAYYDTLAGGVVIGNNYDCTVDDLATAMLKVYDNYDHYLAMSENARKWASQYAYESLKYRYINMVKPRQIILGDRNEITDEYLMTDSQELYEKYKAIR